MLIDDEQKAKEVLADIGYYRLGFYWYHFEKILTNPRSHEFLEGTRFMDALKLYYLDSDLRHILSKYLYRVEVNFRTAVIYTASLKYSQHPTWFASGKFVQSDFTDELLNLYTKTVRRAHVIQEHHKHHVCKYAPAWKTLEFMPFGSVIRLYSSLRDEELKSDICKRYGIRNNKIFLNYMEYLRYLRNLCAHGKPLFDIIVGKMIKSSPAVSIKAYMSNNLSGMVAVLLAILGKISANRAEELRNVLLALLPNDDELRTLRADVLLNLRRSLIENR